MEECKSGRRSLVNKFEKIWVEEEKSPQDRSLAERASLICRALYLLPPIEHAAWGERAARCLADADADAASGSLGAYEPAGRRPKTRSAEALSKKESSLSHIFNEVVEALGRAASVDAVCEAFFWLKRHSLADQEEACAIAQEVFQGALPRICLDKECVAVARMLDGGARLSMETLRSLRALGGEAMENGVIAKAAKAAIEEELAGERFSPKLCAAWMLFYPSSRQWPHARMSPFECEDIISGGAAWGRGLCEAVATSPRAWAAVAALVGMLDQAKEFRSVVESQDLLAGKEPALVADFIQKAEEALHVALGRLAEQSSALAARAIMAFCRGGVAQAWMAAGLGSVPEDEFMNGPPTLSLSGARGGLGTKKAIDASEASREHGLNAMDCLILSAGSREEVMRLAEHGGAPSPRLAKALERADVQRVFNPEHLLWVESFRANPAASPSGRQLRI